MLDRTKLIQACRNYTSDVLITVQDERERGCALWRFFVHNIPVQEQIRSVGDDRISGWSDLEVHTVSTYQGPYTACSLDGSQIYPDRHQGFLGYLINIGRVALVYGATSRAELESSPLVYFDETSGVTPELVNAQRTGLEFEHAVSWCERFDGERLLFFDGSLIFWHLSAHEESVREKLLAEYLKALESFYQKNIPVIGYISLPQSKELVAILRHVQAYAGMHRALQGTLDFVVDADVVEGWLAPGQRTGLFSHESALMSRYPEHNRVYFFYLNTGEEIARIELPQWLCPAVDRVASLVMDQVGKGRGYPVCIAEAHEQAVVTTADREFFYYLIAQQSLEHRVVLKSSQKSIKKRTIGI